MVANDVHISLYFQRQCDDGASLVICELRLPEPVTQVTARTGREEKRQRYQNMLSTIDHRAKVGIMVVGLLYGTEMRENRRETERIIIT